jgi:hypothetical protein
LIPFRNNFFTQLKPNKVENCSTNYECLLESLGFQRWITVLHQYHTQLAHHDKLMIFCCKGEAEID